MTEDLQKQNNYCPRAMECDRHRGFTEYPLITLSLFTKGGDVEWGAGILRGFAVSKRGSPFQHAGEWDLTVAIFAVAAIFQLLLKSALQVSSAFSSRVVKRESKGKG